VHVCVSAKKMLPFMWWLSVDIHVPELQTVAAHMLYATLQTLVEGCFIGGHIFQTITVFLIWLISCMTFCTLSAIFRRWTRQSLVKALNPDGDKNGQ